MTHLSKRKEAGVKLSKDQVEAEYVSGMTMREIALAHGVSNHCVFNTMCKFGIESRRAARRPGLNRDRMIATEDAPAPEMRS